MGFKGLQGVTEGYKWLQGVTGGYNGFQRVTRGYTVYVLIRFAQTNVNYLPLK